jgi:hypothetical protein
MYQSEIFYAEAAGGEKNMMQMKDHCINPVSASASNMDINYLNLVRENFDLRERNNQLIKFNNQLMIEISQLKLEIEMLELKKALSQEDR